MLLRPTLAFAINDGDGVPDAVNSKEPNLGSISDIDPKSFRYNGPGGERLNKAVPAS
jgi:hypothetical protein